MNDTNCPASLRKFSLYRRNLISVAFPVDLTYRGSISLDIAGRRWRWRKQRRWPVAFVIRRVARCNVASARLYYTIQRWRILIESHDRSIKERLRDNVTSVSANEDRPRNYTWLHKRAMSFLWLKIIGRLSMRHYTGDNSVPRIDRLSSNFIFDTLRLRLNIDLYTA